jgi:hypothetical protein
VLPWQVYHSVCEVAFRRRVPFRDRSVSEGLGVVLVDDDGDELQHAGLRPVRWEPALKEFLARLSFSSHDGIGSSSMTHRRAWPRSSATRGSSPRYVIARSIPTSTARSVRSSSQSMRSSAKARLSG